MGGVIGNGDLYEQYQIIEQDFINFIKIVPLNDPYHLKVHSPILRDIIIRACVQIEIFFKEWAKFECSKNNIHPLFKDYNRVDKRTKKIGGVRNWNFGDYFIFKESFIREREIHVRPMNNYISPFESWINEKEPPVWWQTYNSIKHNGLNAKTDANLKNTLDSLGALFTLHCVNHHSRRFLTQFSNNSIDKRAFKIQVRFSELSSPLDTKRYLFKDFYGSFERPTELVTMEHFKNRDKKRL